MSVWSRREVTLGWEPLPPEPRKSCVSEAVELRRAAGAEATEAEEGWPRTKTCPAPTHQGPAGEEAPPKGTGKDLPARQDVRGERCATGTWPVADTPTRQSCTVRLCAKSESEGPVAFLTTAGVGVEGRGQKPGGNWGWESAKGEGTHGPLYREACSGTTWREAQRRERFELVLEREAKRSNVRE